MTDRGISNHGEIPKNIFGRRLLRDERHLQMTNDPVDDRVLGWEGHDSHPPPAARADHRVHLVDLYHFVRTAYFKILCEFKIKSHDIR